MARPIDPRPTLLEVMKHHHITLARLTVSVPAVFPKDVDALVEANTGTPQDIDLCLKALSFLAKQSYTRREVGGFTSLGSKAEQVRLRRYHFVEGTSPQDLERLREYEVGIEETMRPSAVSEKWMTVLPGSWKATVPSGTYDAFFESQMFEGRGVTNDDILMILPLGLQVHARKHQIEQRIYHQIMGLYDPAIPDWHR